MSSYTYSLTSPATSLVFNPFPNNNFYCSTFREFADDNFKCDENGRHFSKFVENTVGKGEIAR